MRNPKPVKWSRVWFLGLSLLAAFLRPVPPPVAAEHRGSPHPVPVARSFHRCPQQGRGGDPRLNLLKNRVEEPARYESWTLGQLLDLPLPKGVGRKRADWPPEAAEVISQYEGAPIRIVGFLIRQKKQGPESTNCGSTTFVDYHFWVTAKRGQLQAQSAVAEPTPRTMANHPNWRGFLRTNKRYEEGEEPRVRIAGWLLFDQEHPEQLGEHRGTLWEIHPVTNIDVWDGAKWLDLDETP